MKIDYQKLIEEECNCEITYSHRGGDSMGWLVCDRCNKLGKLIDYLNKNMSTKVKKDTEVAKGEPK